MIKRLHNASESTCQVKLCTMASLYMWNDQNEHGKKQDHYAKQCKIIDQYNQHINLLNEYGNEA